MVPFRACLTSPQESWIIWGLLGERASRHTPPPPQKKKKIRAKGSHSSSIEWYSSACLFFKSCTVPKTNSLPLKNEAFCPKRKWIIFKTSFAESPQKRSDQKKSPNTPWGNMSKIPWGRMMCFFFRQHQPTRCVPTSSKYSYNPCKWPYNWWLWL